MIQVNQKGVLEGTICSKAKLDGSIRAKASLRGEIVVPQVTNAGWSLFEGEYSVTPETYEQVIPTAFKRMKDDLTVFAIPYYETTNETGGNTVYIGMEVEIHG